LSLLKVYEKGQFMEIDLSTGATWSDRNHAAKGETGLFALGFGPDQDLHGSRLLRKWIEQPLLSIPAITKAPRGGGPADAKREGKAGDTIALSEMYDLSG
jgi:hypothetical protein